MQYMYLYIETFQQNTLHFIILNGCPICGIIVTHFYCKLNYLLTVYNSDVVEYCGF